jgi:hypothetical protein
VTTAVPFPAAAQPLLVAAAAGVLVKAARISVRAAAAHTSSGRRPAPAAMAAALAVHATG